MVLENQLNRIKILGGAKKMKVVRHRQLEDRNGANPVLDMKSVDRFLQSSMRRGQEWA